MQTLNNNSTLATISDAAAIAPVQIVTETGAVLVVMTDDTYADLLDQAQDFAVQDGDELLDGM